MLADIPLDDARDLDAAPVSFVDDDERLPLPVATATILGVSGLLWYGVIALVTSL